MLQVYICISAVPTSSKLATSKAYLKDYAHKQIRDVIRN
jgi:hypothetical protein